MACLWAWPVSGLGLPSGLGLTSELLAWHASRLVPELYLSFVFGLAPGLGLPSGLGLPQGLAWLLDLARLLDLAGLLDLAASGLSLPLDLAWLLACPATGLGLPPWL